MFWQVCMCGIDADLLLQIFSCFSSCTAASVEMIPRLLYCCYKNCSVSRDVGYFFSSSSGLEWWLLWEQLSSGKLSQDITPIRTPGPWSDKFGLLSSPSLQLLTTGIASLFGSLVVCTLGPKMRCFFSCFGVCCYSNCMFLDSGLRPSAVLNRGSLGIT